MKLIPFLLLSQIPLLLNGQAKVLPPMPDNTLVEFIENLEKAVESRDKNHIFQQLSPEVMVSFGDDAGVESFKRYWELDKEDNELFWKTMQRLLKLGGGVYVGNNSYTIPYVSSAWPEAYDAFEYVAITGSNVNVRDQPNTQSSKVIGQFSYDVVKPNYGKSVSWPEGTKTPLGYEWYYVQSPDDSLEGFVYGSFVQSPLGYRLGLTKKEKRWMITFLVAGD